LTIEIGLVLGIIGITMVLFSIEKIVPDVIALGVIVILVLSGLLPLERALAGIGSEAFILVLGLLVMTAGLEKTGVVDMAGDWIVQQALWTWLGIGSFVKPGMISTDSFLLSC